MTKITNKNVKLNVRIAKKLRDEFNSFCKENKTTISKEIIRFINGKINGN